MQAGPAPSASIVERLHAERDAVDAGGAIAAKARRLDAGRIGFQRDFDVAAPRASALPIASRIAPTVCGCISDGVPPPRKIEDTSRPGARAAVVSISRAKARTNRSSSIGRMTDVAVEVAIRTFRQAERPMHIDAEGWLCQRPSRQISASFTKARARCDSPRPSGGRPCFSLLVISPKVRVCPSGRKTGS